MRLMIKSLFTSLCSCNSKADLDNILGLYVTSCVQWFHLSGPDSRHVDSSWLIALRVQYVYFVCDVYRKLTVNSLELCNNIHSCWKLHLIWKSSPVLGQKTKTVSWEMLGERNCSTGWILSLTEHLFPHTHYCLFHAWSAHTHLLSGRDTQGMKTSAVCLTGFRELLSILQGHGSAAAPIHDMFSLWRRLGMEEMHIWPN